MISWKVTDILQNWGGQHSWTPQASSLPWPLKQAGAVIVSSILRSRWSRLKYYQAYRSAWILSPHSCPAILRSRAHEAGTSRSTQCYSASPSAEVRSWNQRPAPGPTGPLCYPSINIHVFWLCEYPTGVSLQVSQWFDRAPPSGRQAPLDQGMPSEKVRACRDHLLS